MIHNVELEKSIFQLSEKPVLTKDRTKIVTLISST
jgi:hypothetical protein